MTASCGSGLILLTIKQNKSLLVFQNLFYLVDLRSIPDILNRISEIK